MKINSGSRIFFHQTSNEMKNELDEILGHNPSSCREIWENPQESHVVFYWLSFGNMGKQKQKNNLNFVEAILP
jgi:hypothetical protein